MNANASKVGNNLGQDPRPHNARYCLEPRTGCKIKRLSVSSFLPDMRNACRYKEYNNICTYELHTHTDTSYIDTYILLLPW